MKPTTISKLIRPCCAGLVGVAVLATTTIAGAGGPAAPYDHLKCYKVKDSKMFKRAEANLQAHGDFALQNCIIKPKSKTYCVPVQKTVTDLEDGSPIVLGGENQTGGRLCYALECPKQDLTPLVVSDQFGSRSVEFKKAIRICTPAIEGSVPTTTLPPPPTTTIDVTTTTLGIPTTLPPIPTTLPVVTTLPDIGTLAD